MMRRLPRLRLFSVGVRCQATAKVLEGGWEQWADDDGTPYYHHRATGKTQWHYPLQQDAKPRPPAPEFRRYEEPAKFGRRYDEPAKFGRRDDLWERKPQSNAYGDWEDLAAVEYTDLPPIEKFRCGTHPDVLARSDAEHEAYLQENSVSMAVSSMHTSRRHLYRILQILHTNSLKRSAMKNGAMSFFRSGLSDQVDAKV